jgi:branched-chain amino acid transport system ATP-binding protein
VLEVRDLSIRFGGLQALQDVSLQVNEFEIVGLIGPNGAGKTTAFNCITGFYKPNSGSVTYRGTDVTRLPPHKKAAMGFGRTFQNVGMVKSATALDNLKTAMHARAGYGALSGLVGAGSSWRAERALAERADAILEMLGLQHIRDQRVGGQSYGTLKLLELGCALATDPDILLLDEPTSGMGPDESDELGDRLLALRKEFGLTILVIEHHVPLVLRVCDHVYVLNFGQLLAEGEPSVIQTHPEVVAAYLGGEAPDALAATVETAEDAALDAQLEDVVAHHDDTHHAPDDDPPTDVLPVAPVQADDDVLRPKRRAQQRRPTRRRAHEPARGQRAADRLRRPAGAAGHLLLGGGGADHGRVRAQRRRQDHDGQLPGRPAPGLEGRGPLRRQEGQRPGRPQDGAAGHLAVPRGPARLVRAAGAHQPRARRVDAQGPQGHRRLGAAGVQLLPAARGAQGPARRHAVRR